MNRDIKLQQNRGFTGIDLTIAVIVIMLFVSLITTLFYNIYLGSASTKRSTIASGYMIDVSEAIQQMAYDEVIEDTAVSGEDTLLKHLQEKCNSGDLEIRRGQITESTQTNKPYTLGVHIYNYNQTAGNTDKLDLVKHVVLTIKYKVGKKVEIKQTENLKTREIQVKDSLGVVPKMLDGMTPVKWINEEGGYWQETTISDPSWFDYQNKKWANVMLKDGLTADENGRVLTTGSMFVWIPRYAYKINYTDSNNKSAGGTVEIKILTDVYDNNLPEGYKVHPCFQNGKSNGYRNGEWREELTGIWVAKFEAGYATGGNSAPIVASSVNYTQSTCWAMATETGTGSDGSLAARNWLDGVYGTTTTAIKYPVFQPNTYSMNYISINDSYNIARAMTNNGNIYGLNSGNADSHQMKNSEWGAVAYLTKSQYGLGSIDIAVNNTNKNNNPTSVYAITGGGDYKANVAQSSTGNITGVYDLSGGVVERTSSYIANGDANLKTYGKSMAYNGETLRTTSTEYATVYNHASTDGTGTVDECSINNYNQNKNASSPIYGDAVLETSTAGTGTTSWNSDYSYFPSWNAPFFVYGGRYWDESSAGIFGFNRTDGVAVYPHGFRTTLVAK